MANIIPGTKFAEGAPVASTGQALMPSPADTGGQQVAQAIGQFGGILIDYAVQVEKKKRDAEYSKLQREFDEAGWAAAESVTGDEEQDAKIWQAFEKKADEMAQSSKYEDVNSLLTEHINSNMPNWAHAFRGDSLALAAKNADDQSAFEGQKMLELGDIDGFIKNTNNRYRLKSISKEKRDALIAEAPAQSKLLQAQREIALKNYGNAIDKLDELKDSELTTEQIQQKEVLKLSAERAKGQVSNALINDVMDKVSQGMALNDIEDFIRESGLDAIQQTELMKIAIASEKIWNETGDNPINVTQDPQKLVDTYYKIKTKQITTFDDLFKEFQSGMNGSPAFSYGNLQQLENLRISMTGSSTKIDAAKIKRQSELFELFGGKNGFVPKKKQEDFREAIKQLDELEKSGGDIDAKFEKLKTEIKEEKAKGLLYELFHPFSQPSLKELKKMGYKGSIKNMVAQWRSDKEKLIPTITNADEAKGLPSGTKFIYQGKEYMRK